MPVMKGEIPRPHVTPEYREEYTEGKQGGGEKMRRIGFQLY